MIAFDEIRKILKQEVPFVFIDKVLTYEVGRTITCIKNVSGGEMFSSLHFPTRAVYPGVLLIESVAQTTAVLCQLSKKDNDSDNTSYFALGGVQHFQFIKAVKPGDCLTIHVEILKKVYDMVIVKATVIVKEEIVACGQLSFGVMKDER